MGIWSTNKSLLVLQIVLWAAMVGLCGWGFVNLSYRHARETEAGDQVQSQRVGELISKVKSLQFQYVTDFFEKPQMPGFVEVWATEARLFCKEPAPIFLPDIAKPNWASLQLDSQLHSPAGFPEKLVAAVFLAKSGLPEQETNLWRDAMLELWTGSEGLLPLQHLTLIKALPPALIDQFHAHVKVLEAICKVKAWPEVVVVPEGAVLFYPSASFMAELNQIAGQMGASVHFLDGEPQISVHNQKWLVQKQRRDLLLWFAISLGLLLLALTIFFAMRALIRVNEQRQRLVHSVSHEFRTPLAAILQFAELLTEGRVRGMEKRTSYYRHIHQQAERLRLLIENVLTFARVEKRLFRIQKERVVIQKFVEDALEPVLRTLGGNLEVHCWEDSEFSFDPDAVTTVLINLVNNAKQYGSFPIEVSHGVSDKRWQIDVSDFGNGLPTKSTQKVFEAYTRFQSDREGLGLGLNLCRTIVQAHGGTIEYLRHDGKTVFRIVIPGA